MKDRNFPYPERERDQKMTVKPWWLVSFALFLSVLIVGTGFGQEEGLYKITVLGNAKVEEGVIRGAIRSRLERPLSLEQVQSDLRAIFALGYFTDVQVDIQSTPQGKELIFIVVEKPSIKEVVITGNEKVKLDDIKEKVTLASRSILNLEKIKENVEQIRKVYFSKGYYGVKVAHKIDYLETNEAVVTFEIEEGPKGDVRKIIFKGNERIKSSDLKKVMTTKEWNILSFLTKSGTLDEDALKNDMQILTAYYFDKGFLDVKISEPKIDLSDPKRIRIETEISEGPQYRFGNIDLKGDVLTSKEDLFKVVSIRRNEIFSNSALRRDVGALTSAFADRGYAFVEVSPETAVDHQNLLVHVTYAIDKKKQVSFERIQIVGNTKSRDKVVRRELQVAEGEIYSVTGLALSRDRLKRSGYFKDVEFATSRGSTDDKINLNVKVEEAQTGTLSFGVGYSSLYQAMIMAQIADRNLFGLGYIASLRANLGGEANDFKFSFTDPYFLGYSYSAGFDAYMEHVEYFSDYNYNVRGFDFRVGKELTPIWRLDGMYKLEEVDIYDVALTAPRSIKDQEGKATTSAISVGLSVDTRNDYFAPSRGQRSSVTLMDAGGILGGDNYFVKGYADTSWYFPLTWNLVLNLKAKLGIIEPYGGKEVPVYEKFYVGGIQTIRGFEYGMAGPIDFNGDPLGANKMAVFTTEILFPLAGEFGLRGAVFCDVGKGFDSFGDFLPVKIGAGPGIRWFSPFGLIRIDLGFNLNPKEGEKSQVLEFSMGMN
jgi:outer membrane protein insertion porin family